MEIWISQSSMNCLRRDCNKNCVVDTNYRNKAYRFIEKQVQEGHQVYVICPMVEESEGMDGENVIDYAERCAMNFHLLLLLGFFTER